MAVVAGKIVRIDIKSGPGKLRFRQYMRNMKAVKVKGTVRRGVR